MKPRRVAGLRSILPPGCGKGLRQPESPARDGHAAAHADPVRARTGKQLSAQRRQDRGRRPQDAGLEVRGATHGQYPRFHHAQMGHRNDRGHRRRMDGGGGRRLHKRARRLCLIETAKITNEVEAEYDAVVKRLIVPAGGDAQAVGVLLAVFADADASDAEVEAFIASFKAADTSVAAKAGGTCKGGPGCCPGRALRPKSKPTARSAPRRLKLAEERGVDLAPIDRLGARRAHHLSGCRSGQPPGCWPRS